MVVERVPRGAKPGNDLSGFVPGMNHRLAGKCGRGRTHDSQSGDRRYLQFLEAHYVVAAVYVHYFAGYGAGEVARQEQGCAANF